MSVADVRFERTILANAIDWFREDPARFDGHSYGTGAIGEFTTTCAIGGIEQAIYRSVSRRINEDLRGELAYVASETEAVAAIEEVAREDETVDVTDEVLIAYTEVMGRLNRIAVAAFSPANPCVRDVEDVAMGEGEDDDDTDRDRERTLRIFDAALVELDLMLIEQEQNEAATVSSARELVSV